MTGINTYKKIGDPIRGRRRKGYLQDALFAANELVPSEQRESGISLSLAWALTSLGWPCRTARAVAQVSAPTLFLARDLRLLSAKAHTSLHPQLPQNPHFHKNRGGVRAKDLYVEVCLIKPKNKC